MDLWAAIAGSSLSSDTRCPLPQGPLSAFFVAALLHCITTSLKFCHHMPSPPPSSSSTALSRCLHHCTLLPSITGMNDMMTPLTAARSRHRSSNDLTVDGTHKHLIWSSNSGTQGHEVEGCATSFVRALIRKCWLHALEGETCGLQNLDGLIC